LTINVCTARSSARLAASTRDAVQSRVADLSDETIRSFSTHNTWCPNNTISPGGSLLAGQTVLPLYPLISTVSDWSVIANPSVDSIVAFNTCKRKQNV
jgi:hypothetical protein